MRVANLPVALVVFMALFQFAVPQIPKRSRPALIPPMGWNSWDSYGLSVTEQEFLDNATWMAGHLKKFGWQYAVVDEGWYLPNPEAKPDQFQFRMDGNGRYQPAENRFPSVKNGNGFAALSGQIHKLGLKFGIHIIRGIPKQAVDKELKIANSSFLISDAADTSDTCPWNADNYGVRNNPAGQEYYDSLAQLYASWGVDLLKVDCIASHPYKGDEIEMISEALRKTGRNIVLSLSPGPAPLDKASDLGKWADMWRISDDVWDVWKSDTGKAFPQDLTGQFQKTAAWAGYVGDGHWPDADMLPVGHLGPRPGYGEDRDSLLKPEEQRTLLTLWCIFRSPLILGANLTRINDATIGLLTNPEVLAVDQHSSKGHQVSAANNALLWRADELNGAADLAVFNLGEEARSLEWSWKQAGLQGSAYKVRDLWRQTDLGLANKLKVTVPRHGSMLLRVQE